MPQCNKCLHLYKEITGCLNCFNKDNPYYNANYGHKGLYKGLISGRENVEEGILGEKQFARDVEFREQKSSENYKKIVGTILSQKGY